MLDSDKEKKRAAWEQWYAANRDKKLEYDRNYRKTHKPPPRERLRPGPKPQVSDALTIAEAQEIMRAGCFFADETCSGALTIAHDVPASKGGRCIRGNVFCLCASHNARMGTKTLEQMVKQLNFL